LPGEKLYKGTVGTLTRIWQEEGIRGLYRGLGPTVLGYLPTWAIYFTAYDYCKSHWADELGMSRVICAYDILLMCVCRT
jgi:solute carrier family 25 folate transporter 32